MLRGGVRSTAFSAHRNREVKLIGRSSQLVVHAQNKGKKAGLDGRATPIKEDEKHYKQLYTSPDFFPKQQFSPAIRLQQSASKGRGLVAQGGIIPGDLLLVSQPVGQVVCGPEGMDLRPEQLVAHLQAEGALSNADRARLALLFDGTPESSRRPIALQDFMSALGAQGGEKEPPKKQPASSKGFGAPPKPAPPPPPPAEEVTGERLKNIVRYNCWGIEYADLAAAPLRKQVSNSYIGVWPEISLVNHSCVPNTQPVLIGDRLLLRAASDIPEGGELTISYLGAEGGSSPVAERRKRLSATYGFTCNCPRCKTEAAAPENVRTALEHMWSRMTEEGTVMQAKELLSSTSSDSTAKLLQLQQGLENEVAAFEGIMEQHALDPRVRQWLRASAYASYELLAVCRDEQQSSSNGGAPAVPSDEQAALLLPLISIINPASDTHLFLALEWLERAGKRYGNGHETTKQASQACLAAHLMRYGRVPNELLVEVIKARSQVEYNLGRINLPRPSAAAATASRA